MQLPHSRHLVAVTLAIGLMAASVAVVGPANTTGAQTPVDRRATTRSASVSTSAEPGDHATRQSMPAAPTSVLMTQPDGSTFRASPWGNWSKNGYAVNGYSIARDASGTWRYVAGLAARGEAVLSSVRPDKAGPPASIARGLRPATAQSRGSSAPQAAPSSPTQAPHAPIAGQIPTLVILAQFNDMTSRGTTPAHWASEYFGAAPSVRDYYNVQSFGQLDVVPAHETSGAVNDGVVGWVNLGIDHPDSGATGDESGDLAIASKAITAADPYVNYASYDTNGDGIIENRELMIVVIAAGYEAAYSGPDAACGASVWAHHWSLDTLSGGPPVLDGKTVAGDGGTYMMFGEQDCATGDEPGHPATMGVMAHEMGHALELPDLYDPDSDDGTAGEGLGEWSLMASGSWNTVSGQEPGAVPAGLDAFSRTYEGWVIPTQIGGAATAVTLTQGETTQRILRLRDNPNGVDWSSDQHSGTGEYFLVENRQLTGYDAGLPGCGILIYHVDETRPYDNSANADATHPLVALEQADGYDDLGSGGNRGDDGDPYPGSSGNTAFTSSSNPNSKLYSGASSGVSVTIPPQACSATMNLTITAPGSSDPGMLRVTTTPAVPSQITVDGHIADTWGLNWVKLSAGAHQVCFGDVPGFTTPACQTATITAGSTTVIDGAFTARGYLRVQTSPPVASTITVDGNPANDWGVWTDLPTGSHQVCFGAVAGFNAPSCQTVTVSAGQTTNVTGTFTSNPQAPGPTGKGMLRVTTSPAVPSRISLDGHVADTWGLNWVKVDPGTHQICFSGVQGYTTPTCQNVTVTAGNVTTATGSFAQRGQLKAVTSPALPATITIDGFAADDWGVWTDLPPGSHQVCFGSVLGYTTPACKTVTVTAGSTVTVTGTYT